MEVLMTDENSESRKEPTPVEKEFNEAVERLWRKYGKDLAAFQRDVQKELEKRDRGESQG